MNRFFFSCLHRLLNTYKPTGMLQKKEQTDGDRGMTHSDRGMTNSDRGMTDSDRGMTDGDRGMTDSDRGMTDGNRGMTVAIEEWQIVIEEGQIAIEEWVDTVIFSDRSWKTVLTQIRFLMKEQSDQSLHFWPSHYPMVKTTLFKFRTIAAIFNGCLIFS